MRVALLHNPSAGSEDHTHAELASAIQKAGHQVAHLVERVSDLTAALQHAPCDLVVIAGGDGTVGRAACELAGWNVPLSIVPLGTANNTAGTLDLPPSPNKLAKSWHQAERVPFDLALFSDGAVRQRFAEGVGWGVFAETVAEAKRRTSDGTVKQTLKRDRKLFRSFVSSVEPRPYRVEVDGRDCSGEYVLVEVMNVPLLGPQLRISPLSKPSDGLLDVVLAKEGDRAALDLLATTGVVDAGALRTERGARIRIETDQGVLHRDGRLVRHAPGLHTFEIDVEPHAVEYLR